MIKRSLLVLTLAVAAALAVLVVRTVQFTPQKVAVSAPTPFTPLPGAVARLSAAVKIPTVSPNDSLQRDSAAFRAFHEFLARSYPLAYAAMRRENVGRDALLFTWPGSDTTLAPIVLMGHMDVVPVEPGTDSLWIHPAFSGDVADGYVWGRGTLDDKVTVLGVLEASEALLASGFKPKRTVMLSFGADEEVGGESGAKNIAALLRSRGVHPLFVMDEGGAVVKGSIPGISAPIALIGIAEKGFLTVKLTVNGKGGHSSMPPRHTAAGILARAVTHIEDNQMPSGIRGASASLFDVIGREMPFSRRIVIANRWLFDPLIERTLARNPQSNAIIRTTTAVTMLEGSPKDNVLPTTARAAVNFRILPGDNVAGIIAHVRKSVADDQVHISEGSPIVEPSTISSHEGPAWDMIDKSVRQVYRDALVAPYLVVGATDSRYFRDLTPNVYRFAAMRLDTDDLARVHGTNERISVAAYQEGIGFLAQLLRNSAQ